MKRLLAGACALALLAGSAIAQDTSTSNAGSTAAAANNNANINGGSSANNGGVTVGPDSSTSNSTSGSASNAVNSANNGGVTVGATTVGPDTSNSNSNASANTKSNSVATGGAGGNSSATSGAANAGNAQNITFNSPATPTHTTADIRSAPTLYAPALTTTLTDTCQGSFSIGASAMGGGVTVGSTRLDIGCNRRLYAREVASLTGDREAARAILCQDKDVYDAFIRVGRPCPGAPGYAEQGPQSYVPAPPPPAPPVVINENVAPPPPPPEQNGQPWGTMAPIPNPPPEGLKEPRG
jgi:hypothetical protein